VPPARVWSLGDPPSNSELARELSVSVETIKSHLHALFESFALEAIPQYHNAPSSRARRSKVGWSRNESWSDPSARRPS